MHQPQYYDYSSELVLRDLIRESILAGRVDRYVLVEKASLTAPAGEAVKGFLDDLEIAGYDIDDMQLGVDLFSLGMDGLTAALGSTAVASAASGVGIPIAGAAAAATPFVIGAGVVADLMNASVYAARGEWFDAIVSAISTAPGASLAAKGLKAVGGPAVKFVIIPVIKRVGSVKKISSTTIKHAVNLLDYKAVGKMKAGSFLYLQRRINKYIPQVMPVLKAVVEGNFTAFAKAKNIPLTGAGAKALEKAFNKLHKLAVKPFSMLIEMLEFMSDPALMKVADGALSGQLAAIKSGQHVTKAQQVAQKTADLASGKLGKTMKAKRTGTDSAETAAVAAGEAAAAAYNRRAEELEAAQAEEVQAESSARQAVHRVIMSESKSIIERLAHREVLTECMNDLITEKMIVATVNDITAFKPEIRDWAEVLVDELEKRAERMKDITDKRRQSIINSLVDVAVKDLIGTTGGMTSYSAERFKRKEDEKKYQQMKRSRRLGY